MGIGDILSQFPAVPPGDLEIDTQGLADGVAVRVTHAPTGITRAARGLTPDTFDPALRALVTEVLTEVAGSTRPQ